MGIFKRVTPSLVLYGLYYPGLCLISLLLTALCIYQGVYFFRTYRYSELENIIMWLVALFFYGVSIINVYKIRKGDRVVIWKNKKKALQKLNIVSVYMPGVLCLLFIVAIFMGMPVDQALVGVIPSLIWFLWGIYLVIGMKKNEITIEDFAKRGTGDSKEEEEEKEKSYRIFKFITPSFALHYVYYPGLLGGFAVYIILAAFRGGFNAFFSPSWPNIRGLLWTLFGILLYVWAIANLFRIEKGKKPLFRYTPRRAFHSINTRSAVDMPIALIGILWSMGAKWWTILCIILILLFISWGIFVEVGCYKNNLVPDGFIKKEKVKEK